MFCLGVCFYASIVLLPQRFQAVYGMSPINAGIHLLPFTIVSPLFSIVCGVVLGKAQKSAVYLMMAGAAMTVIGVALMGSLSTTSTSISPEVYGYEVILAAGSGFMMPPLIMMLKMEFNDADLGTFKPLYPSTYFFLTTVFSFCHGRKQHFSDSRRMRRPRRLLYRATFQPQRFTGRLSKSESGH